MKGHILYTVLETMGEGVVNIADLFAAFLNAGYGASYGKIEYEKKKIKEGRRKTIEEQTREIVLRRRFHTLLYQLKCDGLISVEDSKEKIFCLTKRGVQEIKKWKKKKSEALPSSQEYKKEKSAHAIIITFDIPEKERKKRNWLRGTLHNLGFSMIQKSVWMGNIKIPNELLDMILKLKMVEYIEIFEATKQGTLRHVL